MVTPNWQTLRVEVNDRAAIYAEAFPKRVSDAGPELVAWFTHDQAQGVLYTFAGAWPALGRDATDPTSTPFLYLIAGEVVCRFRGVELAPGAIVVDDMTTIQDQGPSASCPIPCPIFSANRQRTRRTDGTPTRENANPHGLAGTEGRL